MNFFSALYQLFIGPLALFFEVIFSLAYKLLSNAGLAIIFLSLAMNFLVLPLYKKADDMQAQERETEQKLKKWTTHIKKTFSGDERYMMLQTYYRQNNYKPTYALKGSLSLLLEIPFFIAAYQFLSHLGALNGVSFWFIRDLGQPDALFTIGTFTVNVLPILMTVINIVSGMIYTKGLPLKSKIQLYGMALIFLVFLYQSPAGLVFYWTLNNLFSLLKNIFYKLKNPTLVLSILFSATGLALLPVILWVHPLATPVRQAAGITLLLLLQVPLILYFVLKKRVKKETPPITKKEKGLFRLACVFLTVLLGLLIPSGVLRSSPLEFVDTFDYHSPLWHLLSTVLLAAGLFLVWFNVFYALASDKGKRIMGYGGAVLCVICVVDYMFFSTNLGNISPNLTFDRTPAYQAKEIFINLAVLAAAAALIVFLIRWKKDLARILLLAGGIALAGMAGVNMIQTNSLLANAQGAVKTANVSAPGFDLSKDGKNVVVVMIDRGVGTFVPFLMEEKPVLKEQFAGFTYYPNTLSFGGFTNFGIPSLYGGYDYTPEEMNARGGEKLVDKHNEALKVMPVLFRDNGFRVSVCDPTYAGYQWIPDLNIYRDYPEIRTSITEGRFRDEASRGALDQTALLRRNLFCYAVFKSAPVLAQPALYSMGNYNCAELVAGSPRGGSIYQEQDGPSRAKGTSVPFMETYTTLDHFDKLTDIQAGEELCFAMISNDTPHEPMLLQTPDYVPAEEVDNTAYDAAHPVRKDGQGNELRLDSTWRMIHYHANMAAMLKLGEWMDWLREEGVYDNTRIIIVSDHGQNLGALDEYTEDGHSADPTHFNAFLMVKDFNSRTFTVDETFHTNADTPYFATKGLVKNAANPFTGHPFAPAEAGKEYHVLASREWDTLKNNGYTFLPGPWFSVHDDLRDVNNWKYLYER